MLGHGGSTVRRQRVRALAAQRLERAAELLRGPQRQAGLEAVAVASGHASASHLVRRFRAARGVTPGQYSAASRG